jgi:hypothetical protein
MIRYILLKAVQVSVFFILPIIMYNHIIQGGILDVVFLIIDTYVLELYVNDLRTRSLEKKLHGELY